MDDELWGWHAMLAAAILFTPKILFHAVLIHSGPKEVLLYHPSTILLHHPSLPSFYTILLPSFHYPSTILPPSFYHPSNILLWYHPSAILLPSFKHTSTIPLSLFYHPSIILPSESGDEVFPVPLKKTPKELHFIIPRHHHYS